ncbi:MAG: HAMP domain-containing histidine kinase [Flavipsychrobacter sp.]|nr:HAMP domain-containing histidine kinase [Flavipsychrobacter sp.]
MTNTTKPAKLSRIQALMALSFTLLLALCGHWLMSQYEREKNHLQQDITRLFSTVQDDISDSLLLHAVVQPAAPETTTPADSTHSLPQTLASRKATALLLKNVKLSRDEEKQLFRTDTMVFNDLFNQSMKKQGWEFTATWVELDSYLHQKENILIANDFFTSDHGVLISDFQPFLLRKMLVPSAFILFLLVITAIAFRSTYLGWKKQLSLAHLKDDFISNMSHELKTPVATVKVALEALNNFNVLQQPGRSKEYLEMAIVEMNRLELLVNRALSTSLLESGELQLQKEACDLKQLVDEVVLGMQPKLLKHDATVQVEISGTDFSSYLDKMHTQGVLINLIDNSIKYGVKPVEIRISLTESADSIQLSVTDNGPGIPEEYTARVFEKFFRVPTGNRHNAKGYGLGLSYAAQVMQQHMGSISVANVPDGGCRFTLTF